MRLPITPGRGLRRFDENTAAANALVDAFAGLPDGVTHTAALSTLKRAAPYMKLDIRLVVLIDLLASWTKPQDWKAGSLPTVWPSNELLACKLGVTVRQVQKLLNQAQAAGLIGFRDSPNGHRGGKRGADGEIIWAYGIVLAPIGTRYAELTARAARGACEDAAVNELRKRLASARRKIRSIAQAVIDGQISGIDADEDVALALMATQQMKRVRDASLLGSCVEQIEGRADALESLLNDVLNTSNFTIVEQISSCSDASTDIHSTTTNQPQSAKADTSNGLAKRRSGERASLHYERQAEIEADLEKYGVTPEIVMEVAADLCLSTGNRQSWGELTAEAERVADQSGISKHAFREAVRIMGDRGATASVFAAVQKYRRGDVRRPGAYLRGMTSKAARGELHIGRTYHGLKDVSRSAAMRAMAGGTDAVPIGSLVKNLLGRSRT